MDESLSNEPTLGAADGEKLPELATGDRIDRYRVVRLLGRGGMGEVYEVEHETLGTRHALKIIPSHLVRRTGFVSRFEREARVLANLEHPGIVHVRDFAGSGVRYWLLMDLVDGVRLAPPPSAEGGEDTSRVAPKRGDVASPEPEPLSTMDTALPGSAPEAVVSRPRTAAPHRAVSLADLAAARGGRLDQALLADLLSQTLEALAYAHEQGTVHRDLKPGNILLDESDEGLRARISDFGLVRLVGEDWLRSATADSVSSSVSVGGLDTEAPSGGDSTHSLLGTYAYMSPEQKRGDPADARSDLYAVGLMTVRLLTGEHDLGYRLPSEFDAALSKRWDDLARSALDPDPARRPQSAEAMRRDVLAIAEDLATGAAPPLQEKPRRRPLAATLVVLVLLACLAAVGYVAWRRWDDQRKADALLAKAEEVGKTGGLESGIRRLDELLRRYPSAAKAKALKETWTRKLASSQEKREREREASSLLADAERFHGAGQTRKALDGLEALGARYPGTKAAGQAEGLAAAWRRGIETRESERERALAARRAAEAADKAAAVLLRDARQLDASNQRAKAVAKLDELVRRYPGAKVRVGAEALRDGWKKALAAKREAEARLQRALTQAEAQEEAGLLKEALTTLTNALPDAPDKTTLSKEIARVRAKWEAAQAEQAYRRLLSAALAAEIRGDWSAAIRGYQAAREKRDTPEACRKLAAARHSDLLAQTEGETQLDKKIALYTQALDHEKRPSTQRLLDAALAEKKRREVAAARHDSLVRQAEAEAVLGKRIAVLEQALAAEDRPATRKRLADARAEKTRRDEAASRRDALLRKAEEEARRKEAEASARRVPARPPNSNGVLFTHPEGGTLTIDGHTYSIGRQGVTVYLPKGRSPFKLTAPGKDTIYGVLDMLLVNDDTQGVLFGRSEGGFPKSVHLRAALSGRPVRYRNGVRTARGSQVVLIYRLGLLPVK